MHDHPAALRVSRSLWSFGAATFVALASPWADLLQRLDRAVDRLAAAAEWGPAVGLARGLDVLGSTIVTAPLIGAVAIWLALRRRWEALAAWVGAMALSQLVIGPVKALYARPRPRSSLVTTTGWSFPSGHAVAGAAIAVALVIVLVPAGPRRRNLEMLSAAFVVVMAISRVYLRAHWLTDVAAGAALGAAISIGAAAVAHVLHDRATAPEAGGPGARPPSR